MQARSPLAGRRAVSLRPVAATAVALAAVLAMSGCSPKTAADAPAAAPVAGDVTLTAAQRQHIRLYTVAASRFHKTVEATGVVDFDNDQATSVLAPLSGPVTQILVSPGQAVKAGDPLAVVESPDFAAAVGTYNKALFTARNARRLADVDKDLIQHGGVSEREEQQAQTDAANAEADRDAALQALVSLKLDAQTLKDLQAGRPAAHVQGVIRAPIAGTVVEKLITPGQLLQAGTTPCFTVANLSRVWVMAQISGSDLASVRVGDPVEVQADAGGASVAGRVDNISALVNPDTRAVAARVVVDNPGGLLKKQMYVRALVQSRQESTGLLVPVSAILRDDENLPFVYVVQADGGFARQPVTIGYRTGDQYEIAAGLRGGEQVVVDGGIFVQFMQTQ